jgi:opacity protein-like surface antigen
MQCILFPTHGAKLIVRDPCTEPGVRVAAGDGPVFWSDPAMISFRKVFPRLLAFCLLSLPLAVHAQVFGESRAGALYIGGGLGGFSEESNAQMPGANGKGAGFFGVGFRASPYVAVEAELIGWKQDFPTTAGIITAAQFSSQDARTDISTGGLGGLVKVFLPLDRVDLYAGAGLGLYSTTLKVSGTSGGGAPIKIDETDDDVGYQLLLGADVYVSRRITVGLEYRWLKLDASFEPFLAGKIDAGGQFLFATVRGHF